MSIESGKFEWFPGKDPEREIGGGEREPSVDLRHESEVFADHERLGGAEDEAWLALARDTLAEDTDGVLHIDIPDYRYDPDTNPFVGVGPQVTRIFQVARVIDVVLLHRFMFHDILVCGLRSADYAQSHTRANFVKRVRESGGGIVSADDILLQEAPGAKRDEVGRFEFEAMRFAPYVSSYSVGSWLERYHKQPPYRDERPHQPVDVWLIYDEHAYERVSGDSVRGQYRLRDGFDRKSSLLAVAQIN